ncbi:putative Saccharopine dehydrogenase protein [Pseudoloma neurophilia]|uniref:Putative Saccharopine dehydrogenase protein n=1 Tax=Pseudoloma neurophilia TaxID=146866 RepID=A0A0R0LTX9_9MICR|nr:putative Saccharopine dehydrogenase protein [Pseudoloma neurophilia]
MREFDIIIYGASGITAKYVIKEISQYKNLKVALAARTVSKIEYNPENYPTIQCSIDTIDDITKRTDILLNCAGPYIKCGEPIVASCIKEGCHYIDITGETQFIRNIREKYHDEAVEKGIFILNCAGFDSIPSDISFDVMKRRILQECPVENHNTIEIWNYLKTKNFVINYGTWESLILGVSDYYKLPKKTIKQRERKLPKKLFYSEDRKTHCAIFMGTDHSVVTRSQAAFFEVSQEPKVQFYIYVELGSLLNKIIFCIFFAIIMFLIRFQFGRQLLLKYPGFFTYGFVKRGIEDHQIEISSFRMNLEGFYMDSSNNRKKLLMKVDGPDTGYKTTPICMVTAAIIFKDMLENQFNSCLFKGGVLTPAMLFRNTDIVEKLKERGVIIE